MTPKAMEPMTFFLYYDVFLPKNLFWNLEPPLCTGRFTPLAPLWKIFYRALFELGRQEVPEVHDPLEVP